MARQGETDLTLSTLLEPRLLVCMAGSYPDRSEHCLDPATARDVLRESLTRACVINIPTPESEHALRGLSVFELLDAYAEPERVVPLLNTSRAADAAQAKRMIEFSHRAFATTLGESFVFSPLFKLEVLDRRLRVNDREVIRCLEMLAPAVRGRTLPIVSPVAGLVRRLVELGVPAVRLLSGRIGEATGIVDPKASAAAIEAAQPRPVILEGGIDTPDDVEQAARLGAAAVLINSAFVIAQDAAGHARQLRAAAYRAWSMSDVITGARTAKA